MRIISMKRINSHGAKIQIKDKFARCENSKEEEKRKQEMATVIAGAHYCNLEILGNV